jgi:autotransporter-associated beta strand protein
MATSNKARLVLASAVIPILGLSLSRSADAAVKYWDLNGTTAGAGTTPTGTWDATTTNWNPVADGTGDPATFAANDDAIFSAGSDATGAFTITLSSPAAANSATVNSGTIAFTGGTINTGTNAVTINAGAQVNIPISTVFNSAGKVVLDGGTLKNTNAGNAGSFISAAKTLEITSNGGTVAYDDGSSANAFTTIYTGTVTGTGGTTTNGGVGTLTKTGVDEFRYQGSNTANTTFAKLVVNQGLFRLGSVISGTQQTTEAGFGAAPTALLNDAITLNGGAIGASFGVTLNANRGITIGANGGTFNAVGGGLVVPGPVSGSGKITVTGAAGVSLNNTSNATTFTGALQADGLLTLNQSLTVTNLTGTSTGNVSVASGRTLTAGGDNASTTYAGLISGAGAFTKTGTGTLTMIVKEWTNTGAVNVNGGALKFGDANAGFSNGSTVTVAAAATLDMNAINDTFGAIAGAGALTNIGNLSVGTNNASTTFSGTIGGAGNLTKVGTGTLTVTGASAHTGTTNVNGGTLVVAGATAAALAGTSGLAVGSATFTLGKSNQVNNAAPVTLTGGTLNTAGFSEGSFDASGNGVAGLGALTVAATSTVDLGAGSSVLAFADSSAATWAGSTALNVYNWTGTPDLGGGADRLYFGSSAAGLTPAQLAEIKFFSDAGTTQIGNGATMLGTGEIVPVTTAVPEPTALALLGLGAAAITSRRRRAK